MTAPTKPDAERLLPCPFCGGEAQIKSRKYARVECIKCFVITRHYNSDDLAREEWNTRPAPDAAQLAALDELTAETEKLGLYSDAANMEVEFKL